MNYTENCHLPQWEENDRVLRTDFNEAFAALEEVGTKRDRLQTVAENLARDAYRREVQHRVRMGPAGESDGMWINTLTSREDAGGDGHMWNGRYGVCYGAGGIPTLEGIKASVVEECFLATSTISTYTSEKAIVTFISDGFGMIDKINVWAVHDYRIKNSKNFSFFITMARIDTGEEFGPAGPFTSISGDIECDVHFPIEAGVQYRLQFSNPEGSEFFGIAGFGLQAEGHTVCKNPLLTFSQREPEDNIVKTIIPEGRRAIGLARWKGDGAIELSVNGQQLTEVRNRETVNALGESCVETEYALESLPEKGFSLCLRMEQGEQDLNLFDYGLIWR